MICRVWTGFGVREGAGFGGPGMGFGMPWATMLEGRKSAGVELEARELVTAAARPWM